MTTSIVLHNRPITPDIVQQAEVLASRTARFMGMTEAVALATYLKGYEVGFKMTASPEFIHVIQGKPSISPRGHLALLHNSGIFQGNGCLKVTDWIDDNGIMGCTVYMKRGDSNVEYECTVTLEDAKSAGLIKKGSGWESWPANMLRWRCIGFAADIVAPDIGGGMKRSDEYGADIDQDGNVINTSWEVLMPKPSITLDQLFEAYGNDAVIAAMGDKPPSSQQEIDDLALTLENGNE